MTDDTRSIPLPVGLLLGVAFGILLGLLIDSLWLGIVIGLLLGAGLAFVAAIGRDRQVNIRVQASRHE